MVSEDREQELIDELKILRDNCFKISKEISEIIVDIKLLSIGYDAIKKSLHNPPTEKKDESTDNV